MPNRKPRKQSKLRRRLARTAMSPFSPNVPSPTNVPPVTMNPVFRMVIDSRAHPTVDTVYSRTYADWINYAGRQRINLAPGDLATAPIPAVVFTNIRIRKVNCWGPTGGSVEILRNSSIAVPSKPVKFDEGAASSDRPFVVEPFPSEAWASSVVTNPVNLTVVPFVVSAHVAATDEVKTQTNIIVHVHVDVW